MASSHTEIAFLVIHRQEEAKRLIRNALSTHDGNVSKAAETVGVSRATLHIYMNKLGMDAAKFRPKRPKRVPSKTEGGSKSASR